MWAVIDTHTRVTVVYVWSYIVVIFNPCYLSIVIDSSLNIVYVRLYTALLNTVLFSTVYVLLWMYSSSVTVNYVWT